MSVYTDMHTTDASYGWSYIFGWISVALTLFAGILSVISGGYVDI